ncbi:GspH/FimT family pseudopilin [Luteibacter aegosomaticola]|uniref:GspH/FimT family pseudopilin n=1 Tax=Luteibacter aegosomaticola TaxID=2911538 RepID=UPI001FF82B65|nr:GspH/FimT family pseudopilin [Luteibacter aegosomaticola]UPG92223.1 GspH/FimT family pseudopilin [Luteibacter aegosomaticola]
MLVRTRGFSIVELMVAILIATILAAIAIPSFRTTIQKHRLRSATDNLQAAIDYARAEAVLRATYVSLCASTDGATCSGTKTYETGWLVYSHPVATTAASDVYSSTASKGMLILRAGAALTLVSARALDTGVVTFGQQGQLEPVSTRTNATQPMAFVLCAVTTGTALPGQNTAKVPGSRIGISAFGASAGTKLNTTDACTL